MQNEYHISDIKQDQLRASLTSLGRSVGADAAGELITARHQQHANPMNFGEPLEFDPYDPNNYPTVGGIYVLYDISQRPLYIGQGRSIDKRLKDHNDKFWFRSPIVETGSYVQIDNQSLRKKVEAVLIKFLKSNAVINKQHVHR